MRKRETSQCSWCYRERPVDLMRKWDDRWECRDWVRCTNVTLRRIREQSEGAMTAKKCCDKPCLVPDWARGIFGHQCTNCRTFTPANGSTSFKVPAR